MRLDGGLTTTSDAAWEFRFAVVQDRYYSPLALCAMLYNIAIEPVNGWRVQKAPWQSVEKALFWCWTCRLGGGGEEGKINGTRLLAFHARKF